MKPGESISQAVSKVISPDSGASVPLTDEDRSFVEQYRRACDALPEESQALAFKNVIRSGSRCGFANGGAIHLLVNSDQRNRYRVTVRTYWRQGIDSGQFDNTHISEAGGSRSLGCSDSGSIPVAYYSREVVGEVRI